MGRNVSDPNGALQRQGYVVTAEVRDRRGAEERDYDSGETQQPQGLNETKHSDDSVRISSSFAPRFQKYIKTPKQAISSVLDEKWQDNLSGSNCNLNMQN